MFDKLYEATAALLLNATVNLARCLRRSSTETQTDCPYVFLSLQCTTELSRVQPHRQEIWQGASDGPPLPDLMIFQWICSIGHELLLINCLFDIEILSNHIARDCMNHT